VAEKMAAEAEAKAKLEEQEKKKAEEQIRITMEAKILFEALNAKKEEVKEKEVPQNQIFGADDVSEDEGDLLDYLNTNKKPEKGKKTAPAKKTEAGPAKKLVKKQTTIKK